MEMRTYVIAIDGDEQYRTSNRGQAKAVYNLVDDQYESSVDGLKKQLIELADDGFNGIVVLEDTIHCPMNDQDEELDEEQSQHRGWHR